MSSSLEGLYLSTHNNSAAFTFLVSTCFDVVWDEDEEEVVVRDLTNGTELILPETEGEEEDRKDVFGSTLSLLEVALFVTDMEAVMLGARLNDVGGILVTASSSLSLSLAKVLVDEVFWLQSMNWFEGFESRMSRNISISVNIGIYIATHTIRNRKKT
jgi:hypothetical protein